MMLVYIIIWSVLLQVQPINVPTQKILTINLSNYVQDVYLKRIYIWKLYEVEHCTNMRSAGISIFLLVCVLLLHASYTLEQVDDTYKETRLTTHNLHRDTVRSGQYMNLPEPGHLPDLVSVGIMSVISQCPDNFALRTHSHSWLFATILVEVTCYRVLFTVNKFASGIDICLTA